MLVSRLEALGGHLLVGCYLVQVDKTRLSGQKESDTAEVTGGGRAKPLIFDKKIQK